MATTASETGVISHWYKLFENFQASPMEFYASVEAAIQPRKIPDASTSRVDWKEGGLFSAQREYLRVTRGRLVFDICGAPFGSGFFFSWWLAKTESSLGALALLILIVVFFMALGIFFQVFGFFLGLFLACFGLPILFWLFVKFMNQVREGWDDALVAMPILGSLYERIFRPETYFKMDTALMFQESVKSAVEDVINQMSSAKGIRPLTDLEKKPILREFYRR